MTRSWAVSVLLGTLLGCVAGGPAALAAQGGRVTGGGTRIFTTPEGVSEAHFTISAIKHANGSASGQFQQHDRGAFFVHGEVTCLDFIDDRTALVSGIITKAKKVPAGLEYIREGAPFLIYIQDNGEGAGATPDRVSWYFVGDVGFPFPCGDPGFIAFAAQFFEDFPQEITNAVAGNFQVSR